MTEKLVSAHVKSKDKKVIFDQNSSMWNPNHAYTLMFIKAQTHYFNNVLQVRGNVFLNEVFDALGLPRTPIGAIVGWLNKSDSNVINIDIHEIGDGRMELQFNVEEIIWDLI